MLKRGLIFTFVSVLGVFAIVFAYWKYNGGTNISGTSEKVEEHTVDTPLFKLELKMNGERMSVEKYYKIDAGQTIQIEIENTKENPVSCRSLLVEDGFSK